MYSSSSILNFSYVIVISTHSLLLYDKSKAEMLKEYGASCIFVITHYATTIRKSNVSDRKYKRNILFDVLFLRYKNASV